MRPKIFLCPRFSKVGTDFWYLVKFIKIESWSQYFIMGVGGGEKEQKAF